MTSPIPGILLSQHPTCQSYRCVPSNSGLKFRIPAKQSFVFPVVTNCTCLLLIHMLSQTLNSVELIIILKISERFIVNDKKK